MQGATSRHGWRRFIVVFGLALAALSASSHSVWAQRLAPDLQKSGTRLRYAFREITSDASRATVRILADGRQVALGAVVGSNGYVLTKASQLGDQAIVVQFGSGRRFDAEIVGLSKDYDLAMLKIDGEGLPAVEWAPTDSIGVGQWLATPSPGSTPVAVGVVSVAPREIPDERGVLGIAISDADLGPQITQIFPNSGAEKAGLQIGDVITRVAGTAVKSGAALSQHVRTFRPGDTLDLLIVRDNEEKSLRAVLGTPSSSILDRAAFQNQLGGELSNRRAGFPSALQHDTVLSPEDCGGIVVDLTGRAVGINIARAGRTETYTIPAGKVLSLIEELKSGKLAPSQYVQASASVEE